MLVIYQLNKYNEHAHKQKNKRVIMRTSHGIQYILFFSFDMARLALLLPFHLKMSDRCIEILSISKHHIVAGEKKRQSLEEKKQLLYVKTLECN